MRFGFSALHRDVLCSAVGSGSSDAIVSRTPFAETPQCHLSDLPTTRPSDDNAFHWINHPGEPEAAFNECIGQSHQSKKKRSKLSEHYIKYEGFIVLAECWQAMKRSLDLRPASISSLAYLYRLRCRQPAYVSLR
jgi:hypothetical protein